MTSGTCRRSRAVSRLSRARRDVTSRVRHTRNMSASLTFGNAVVGQRVAAKVRARAMRGDATRMRWVTVAATLARVMGRDVGDDVW